MTEYALIFAAGFVIGWLRPITRIRLWRELCLAEAELADLKAAYLAKPNQSTYRGQCMPDRARRAGL